MSLDNPKPRKCLHYAPSGKSILFCGEFIHLPSIHLFSGMSMSGLSRIFNHNRNPSLESSEKIAKALGMGLEEFLIGLRGHVVRHKPGPVKFAQKPEVKARKTRRFKAYARMKEAEEKAMGWPSLKEKFAKENK